MKYRWDNEQSSVQDITFKGDGKKTVHEALMYVSQSEAHSDAVAELDKLLVERGFNVSYDIEGDRPILRVTGFLHKQAIVDLLEEAALVSGDAQVTDSEVKPHSISQYIRQNTLMLSAVFYQLGNVVTMLSGFVRRDSDEFKTGVAFGVGDSAMLLFGKRNKKAKHHSVMRGFGEVLEQHGFVAETGSVFGPLADKDKPSSWESTKDFMHDKVIAIKSVSEMSAGVYFSRAGFRQNNLFKGVAGIMVGTGFGLGLAIPEKSDSDLRRELNEKTNDGVRQQVNSMSFVKRFGYFLQKNPLAISGTFSSINNILTLFGAVDERRYIKKSGMSRELKKITAELNGGEYKPSFYSESEMVTESLNDRISASYSQIAATEQRMSQSTAVEGRGVMLETLSNQQGKTQALLAERNKLQTRQKELTEGRTFKIFNKELNVNDKKFWVFNVVQGALFLVANMLYGLSSKGSREAGDELTNRFIAAVATDIVRTAPQDRAEVLSLAAQYAGNHGDIDYTPDEMRQLIQSRVEKLQAVSPWMPAVDEVANQILTIEGLDSVVFNVGGAQDVANKPAVNVTANELLHADVTTPSEAALTREQLMDQHPHALSKQATKENPQGVTEVAQKAGKSSVFVSQPLSQAAASVGGGDTTAPEKLSQHHGQGKADSEWKKRAPSKGNDYSHHDYHDESTVGIGMLH